MKYLKAKNLERKGQQRAKRKTPRNRKTFFLELEKQVLLYFSFNQNYSKGAIKKTVDHK